MRMVHYYQGAAVLLIPALLATLVTGIFARGGETHLLLGLFTSIGCVAQNTLLILFMIVTGRVLKQAIASRELPRELLEELNQFFAQRRAYPVALVAATLAVAAAVLGYGSFIGVSPWIHMLIGLGAILVNLNAIGLGVRSLRKNQELIDRAAAILDELDARPDAKPIEDPGIPWSVGPRLRWLIFAACAWLPYLYWGLIVWHGDFSRISSLFPTGTALVSGLAVLFAFLGITVEFEEPEEASKDPSTDQT